MSNEPAWYRLDHLYRYARQEGDDHVTAVLFAMSAPFAFLAIKQARQNAKRKKERVKQREKWRLEAQEEYEQGESDA